MFLQDYTVYVLHETEDGSWEDGMERQLRFFTKPLVTHQKWESFHTRPVMDERKVLISY